MYRMLYTRTLRLIKNRYAVQRPMAHVATGSPNKKNKNKNRYSERTNLTTINEPCKSVKCSD